MSTEFYEDSTEVLDAVRLVEIASRYRRYDSESQKPVALLKEQRRVRTIETFLGLCEIMRTDWTEPFEKSGLAESVGFVWNHIDHLISVADDPTFTCWVSLLEELINPYQQRRTASDDLKYHIEASGLEETAFVSEHLSQFGAFALATAIFAGTPIRLQVPVSLHYPWLPGTTMEWATENGNGRLTAIGVRDGLLEVLTPSARRTLVTNPRPIPEIVLGNARLRVHANAPAFHLRHIERWPRIMEATTRAEIALEVAAAIELVEPFMPGFTAQVAIILNTCVPMSTNGVTPMASGSYTRLFGTVFLARSPDPRFVAEMFIHEFSHNKLTLLEDVAPLFGDFSRSEFRHYSPWRDTLRSAEGVLHALYVHTEIAKFWRGVLHTAKDNETLSLAQRRLWTLFGQLRFGIEDLRQTGDFTDVGKALLDDIDQTLCAWVAESKPVEKNARPFFSEMKEDPTLAAMGIPDALNQHRIAVWQLASASTPKPSDIGVTS